MPTYKHVWNFTTTGGGGWSEVWYRTASDMQAALTLPPTLVAARLGNLDDQNAWRKVRVSEVGASRVTGLVTINQNGTAGKTVPAGPTPVGAAAVVGMAGVNGGSRKWWLRGISFNFYATSEVTGIDKPSAAALAALNTTILELAKAQFGILQLQRVGQGGVSFRKITGADGSAANGTTVLTIEAGAVYSVGSRVIVSGCNQKDLPSLKGSFTVLAATGTTVTIPYTTPGNRVIANPQGKLRPQAYQAVSVFNPLLCALDHLGTRTSRNPLSASRGARRAARLRNLA